MKGQLLFGTTNPGKLLELRNLLGDDIQVHSLLDFPDLQAPPEHGETFEENARGKALAYSKATRLPALADDSGLCVDALEGRPGVHSARYGPGTDLDRVEKLLMELEGIPPSGRSAAFVCTLCLAWEGRTRVERGECRGEIAARPRGDNGFGYDPVFFVPELGRTMAELSREEKAGISHRGRAFKKMRPHLLELIQG